MRKLFFGMVAATFLVGGVSVALAEDSDTPVVEGPPPVVCTLVQEATEMLKKAAVFEEAWTALQHSGIYLDLTVPGVREKNQKWYGENQDGWIVAYLNDFEFWSQPDNCV